MWVSSTSTCRRCLSRSCFVALDCASACSSQGVGQLNLDLQAPPLALLLCGTGLRLGLQQPGCGSAQPRPAGVAFPHSCFVALDCASACSSQGVGQLNLDLQASPSRTPALWHWTAPRPAAARVWVSSHLDLQAPPLALLLCGTGLRLGLQQPGCGSAQPRPAGVAFPHSCFVALDCASACSSQGVGQLNLDLQASPSRTPALWHWTAPRPAAARVWVSSTSACRRRLSRSCFVALDCASACSSQGVGQLNLDLQASPSRTPALWHWTAPRPAAAKGWGQLYLGLPALPLARLLCGMVLCLGLQQHREGSAV